MIIFLLWWFSVGTPIAVLVYYIDLLNATYVERPWMIIIGATLWPISLAMCAYGAYTNYQWRKEKGDVL